MRTAVYVDGFNLYHSALEARPQFRWLDLHALAVNALEESHQVLLVRYFTARVKGDQGDQGGPQRQDTYVRALACHCPFLSVHWGRFAARKVEADRGVDDALLQSMSDKSADVASRGERLRRQSRRSPAQRRLARRI